MKTAALFAALALAACANGRDVSGTSAYVGVGPVWTEAEALPLAEQHCAMYGKSARFNRKEGVRATFDCI